MTYPQQTTGLNTAAIVKITSSTTPVLTLIGASQALTYQIVAEVTDVAGNVIEGADLYYASSDESIATVSDGGLVTAVGEPGVALITVATPAFGNSINLWTPLGLPFNAVQALLNVSVVKGTPITPDFSIGLSPTTLDISGTGTATTTVTTENVNGFDEAEGISIYVDYPPELYLASHLGEIEWSVGSSSVTFTTSGLAAGTYTFYVWGKANPQAVNSGDVYQSSPQLRGLIHTAALTLVVS